MIKQAGAWVRQNPFRLYLASIILAVLPLTLFVITAHKLFLRQVTAQTVARSSQQGRVIGLIIEQHLNEQKAFVESITVRPDVLRDWQARNYDHLGATLEQLHKLRSDFLGFGVCDVDGNLRAASVSGGTVGQNLSSRPWYGPVSSTWTPYISPVF